MIHLYIGDFNEYMKRIKTEESLFVADLKELADLMNAYEKQVQKYKIINL